MSAGTTHAFSIVSIAASALLAVTGCGPAQAPSEAAGPSVPVAEMNDDDRALYTLGLQVALSLRNYDLSDAEFETMLRGLRDTRKGAPELKVREQVSNLQRFQTARHQQTVQKEKTASTEFVTKAAAETGAERTGSGLVFISLQEGTGAAPQPTNQVKVHYHGTLRDGTVFDSSVERGEPATFPLNGVIPCWTEGVQRMKVGGKAKLICPAEIAYGERGAPPFILPGAALTFEVELLEIVPGAVPEAVPETVPVPQ